VLGPDAAAGPVHVGLATAAGGQSTGYVVYTMAPDAVAHAARPQLLVVRELVWLDADAYRALWSFLGRHDLVGAIEWRNVPAADPAPDLFLEPRLLHPAEEEGMWLRLVDVPAALAGRGWDNAAAELTIAVRGDVLIPANNRAWRLRTTAGGASCCAAPAGTSADLSLGVAALALLFMGRRTASELAGMGLAEGGPEALRTADALFRTRHAPHCADHF
jgi:predicted acetyltransferase